jgi:hypothetical protein
MKSEKQFNQWLTKQFYEASKTKVCVQRIETTTGNGVPDLLVIQPSKILLIESKFETRNIRPEQGAFQIKANEIIRDGNNVCCTLCAYPKTNRLIYQTYNAMSITENGIEPTETIEFTLDANGFANFLTQIK